MSSFRMLWWLLCVRQPVQHSPAQQNLPHHPFGAAIAQMKRTVVLRFRFIYVLCFAAGQACL